MIIGDKIMGIDGVAMEYRELTTRINTLYGTIDILATERYGIWKGETK